MYRVFGEEQLYDYAEQARLRALALGHEGYIFEPSQRPGEPRKPGRWVRLEPREYPCLYHRDVRCVHTDCRLATLPPRIAARLRSGYLARDYASNWGKLLYDEKEHGRDAKRRKAMAQVIRAMRNGNADYAQATRAGAWIGAALT